MVADITYVTIATGFGYLAAILDAWSRRVIGHAIGRSIDARLAVAALKAAFGARDPPKGCMHIPTVGRNMPPMTIAPPCKSTVSPAPWAGAQSHDNAKAESFMKTSRSKPCIRWHTKASRTLQPTFPASSTRFTTPENSTPRSAISAPRNTGPTRPATCQNRRLKLSTIKGRTSGSGAIKRTF